MELLALRAKALQDGETTCNEPETVGEVDCESVTPHFALETAFEHYRQLEPHLNLNTEDISKCKGWLAKALTCNDGHFNPVNQNILDVEKFFELPIEEEWAKYKYEVQGKKVEGQILIRGTMDLITSPIPFVIDAIDYKTGARKNWAKNRTKQPEELQDDFQLRLYHYALSRLYPEYEAHFVTIYYINSGGPFSIPFEPKDVPKTKAIIKRKCEEIRADKRPRRIAPSDKCRYLCSFDKRYYPGDSMTICDRLHSDILQLGIDRVTQERCDTSRLMAYTGGGRVKSE